MTAIPILEAASLSKRYSPRSDHMALKDVEVSFNTGSRVGVVGESGSGKSTLIRCLVGLEQPTAGSVLFHGQEVQGLRGERLLQFRKEVQLVAQDTSSSFDPRKTLRQSLRAPAQILCGLRRAEADQRVDEILSSLGVPLHLAERHAADVSGGQRQRFSLARALIVEPVLLICDEVVSALDVSVQASVLNLLKFACEERGSGLIFVSHGLPATAFISAELMVMQKGLIVDRGSTADVLLRSAHPYTTSLREAYDLSAGEQSSLPGRKAHVHE